MSDVRRPDWVLACIEEFRSEGKCAFSWVNATDGWYVCTRRTSHSGQHECGGGRYPPEVACRRCWGTGSEPLKGRREGVS